MQEEGVDADPRGGGKVRVADKVGLEEVDEKLIQHGGSTESSENVCYENWH